MPIAEGLAVSTYAAPANLNVSYLWHFVENFTYQFNRYKLLMCEVLIVLCM